MSTNSERIEASTVALEEAASKANLSSQSFFDFMTLDNVTDVTLPDLTTTPSLSKKMKGLVDDFEAVKAQYVAETTTAGQQATIATTKAAEAAASQVVIQAAEANVISIQDAMVILFDNFDDRFLGVKTSDPTVDNDGDPLQIGAIYYNSTESVSKFYNGSSWESPDVTATQAAALALGYRNETQTFRNEAEAAKVAAEAAAGSIGSGYYFNFADIATLEAAFPANTLSIGSEGSCVDVGRVWVKPVSGVNTWVRHSYIEDISLATTSSNGNSTWVSVIKTVTGEKVEVHILDYDGGSGAETITFPASFTKIHGLSCAIERGYGSNDSGIITGPTPDQVIVDATAAASPATICYSVFGEFIYS